VVGTGSGAGVGRNEDLSRRSEHEGVTCPPHGSTRSTLTNERSGSGPKLLFFNGSGATLAGTAPLIAPFAGDPDQARAWVAEAAGIYGRTDVPYNNAG
jgi:hypothetical protein